MAQSRCPRSECDSTHFECAYIEPDRSNFKLLATQCAKCGAVVGVNEARNIEQMLFQLAQAMKLDIYG